MKKNDTLFVKGIAIVMMLIIHIELQKCSPWFIPLDYWRVFQRLSIPVFCFIFCSGYGLYLTKEKPLKDRIAKNIKLWLIYQFTTATFVWLSILINEGGTLNFSTDEIFYNVTCIHTSWNGPGWFILPYILITSSSSILFRFMDKVKPILVMLLFIICFLLSGWCISKYHVNYVDSNPHIYNLCYFFFLLFPFYLGAFCSKSNVMTSIKNVLHKCLLNARMEAAVFIFSIILFSLLQIFIESAAFTPVYGCVLIISVVQLISMNFSNKKIVRRIREVLEFLGKQSMAIWIVHSFFLGNIFDVHVVKFPLLIFGILLIASISSSMIINLIIVDNLNRIIK